MQEELALWTRVIIPLAVPIGIPLIVTKVGTEVMVAGLAVPTVLLTFNEDAEPKEVTLKETLYVLGQPAVLIDTLPPMAGFTQSGVVIHTLILLAITPEELE